MLFLRQHTKRIIVQNMLVTSPNNSEIQVTCVALPIGSAILDINEIHAFACSYRHKYQPSTLFLSQQIKTQALRYR